MKRADLKPDVVYVVRGCGERCLIADFPGSEQRPLSMMFVVLNEHGEKRYARARDFLRLADVKP